MSTEQESDAERRAATARFRQRLWGASVLIAIAVIVLPLLLDGSGSESQFRRVEKLRDEPPRIVDRSNAVVPAADTIADTTSVARSDVATGSTLGSALESTPESAGESAPGSAPEPAPVPRDGSTRIRIGEDDPPDYLGSDGMDGAAAGSNSGAGRAAGEDLSAWVVQAGSFRDQDNAVAVRDVLRRAGFATFVTDRDGIFRVHVGPLVDQARADLKRDEVVALLGREAIVVPYP